MKSQLKCQRKKVIGRHLDNSIEAIIYASILGLIDEHQAQRDSSLNQKANAVKHHNFVKLHTGDRAN